jgi:pimeloyl-ACP methyl ester carboxylesterase
MSVSSAQPTVLLVHGAWHGSWCWQDLQTELAGRGWETRTVDLPTSVQEESDELLPSIFDDARVIREAIDGIDGPVAVVAHSYAGIPVTQATAGASNVVHVMYLAAYMLETGESMYTAHDLAQPDPKSLTGIAPPMAEPENNLYADVPEPRKSEALKRLVHQSHRSWGDQVTQAGWHAIPSSYVICDKDQGLPIPIQEKLAVRAGTTYHLDSSHSPFLSMPDKLAELLISAIAE